MGAHNPLFHLLDLGRFSHNFATMSELEKAMSVLKATFEKYAGKKGNKHTISKADLAALLNSELHGGGSEYDAALVEYLSMLDDDKDGLVDFKDYVTFVATLSMLYS